MDDSGSLPPPLDTPPMSRVPSYIQFAPRRAIASFENLVALANYEETLKEARKIVWRNRGEKPVELDDLWECFEHGGRGGLRAGTLAFAIRSGVNLILLMTRIKKVPKSYRFALIRQALFGEDSLRFAAMLGLFVSIYKFVLNSLPILLPGTTPARSHSRSRSKFRATHTSGASALPSASDNPFHEDEEEEEDLEVARGRPLADRQARLSLSTQNFQRKKTRRWYSIVAGALAGGVAILCEKRGRRVGIAQQMFVRGLQGSYNALSTKHGFKIPHGDVIVFSLCCGQILYGFLLRPDTLPRSYVSWIQEAGKIPKEIVSMNKDLIRDHTFKMSDLDALITRRDITPSNHATLLARKAAALAPEPTFGPFFAPCEGMHPWESYCRNVPVERFWNVFKWMVPIYGALHLIPMLLFKWKTVLQDPAKMFLRAGWGTARSSAFLGIFVIIYQSYFCFKNNVWLYLAALRSPAAHGILARFAKGLPQAIPDAISSKSSYWLGGLLSGMSLFVEEARRRPELAMYVLPKGMESAWVAARGKRLVPRTGQYGEALLSAIGMGMVMGIYQNDPQHLSGLVRRIIYQFVGPN
ncbi:hypothetical protein BDW22DRAFT_1363556 [Trametopsis cervina]|nr:hypothetical protein BDW22DRAFT_1363556 [Trametopsis cervina]